MGRGSTKGCCCKKRVAVVPIMGDTITNLQVKTETPNGCCLLYTGASIINNQYTCPILAVHTWDKSMQNVKIERGFLDTVGTPGRSLLNKNRATTVITNANENVEFKVGIDQQIQMVPVEDIISIKISTEVKKAVEQQKSVALKHAPFEELTCCQKVKKALCYCCKKGVPVAPEYVVRSNESRKARRIITVTIEHIRYGLMDTPTHLRVLPKKDQEAFYEQRFHVDTIKFHYLNSEIFDENEYKIQLQESEALARLVMQLKAMKDHYPDDAQLQKIIQQNRIHHFGQIINSDIKMLGGNADVTATTVYRNT